jgi:hypothetical protein
VHQKSIQTEKVLQNQSNETPDTYEKIFQIWAGSYKIQDAYTPINHKETEKRHKSSRSGQIRPRSGRSGLDLVGRRVGRLELVTGEEPGVAVRRRPSGCRGEAAASGCRD